MGGSLQEVVQVLGFESKAERRDEGVHSGEQHNYSKRTRVIRDVCRATVYGDRRMADIRVDAMDRVPVLIMSIGTQTHVCGRFHTEQWYGGKLEESGCS